MNFYIRLVNGIPVDNPISEENLISAFPGINLEDLQGNFAVFINEDHDSSKHPVIENIFEILYEDFEWVGAAVKKVWKKRELSGLERSLIIEEKIKVVNGFKNLYMSTAEKQIALATDDAGREFWVNYKQSLVDLIAESLDYGSYDINQFNSYSFIPDSTLLDPNNQYFKAPPADSEV
jgi:hypothetical protein